MIKFGSIIKVFFWSILSWIHPSMTNFIHVTDKKNDIKFFYKPVKRFMWKDNEEHNFINISTLFISYQLSPLWHFHNFCVFYRLKHDIDSIHVHKKLIRINLSSSHSLLVCRFIDYSTTIIKKILYHISHISLQSSLIFFFL